MTPSVVTFAVVDRRKKVAPIDAWFRTTGHFLRRGGGSAFLFGYLEL